MSNDSVIDIEFGEWIRFKRYQAEITLIHSARDTGISTYRLRSLECGTASTGIKPSEAAALAAAYGIARAEVFSRAAGKIQTKEWKA